MFVVTPLTGYWKQFVSRLTTTWVISSSAIVLVQKGIPGLRDTQIPHRLQRSPCRNSLPRHSVPSHSCNEPQSPAYPHGSQDCHRNNLKLSKKV